MRDSFICGVEKEAYFLGYVGNSPPGGSGLDSFGLLSSVSFFVGIFVTGSASL